MGKLIDIHSKKGDLVLDPFAGGEATLMACKELDRRYIGIEISEEYYKMANEKIRLSNMQPRLI